MSETRGRIKVENKLRKHTEKSTENNIPDDNICNDNNSQPDQQPTRTTANDNNSQDNQENSQQQ